MADLLTTGHGAWSGFSSLSYDWSILHSIRAAITARASSPTVVLAALGVCIAVSFQILLPVVPVLVERSGPHGVAGAATAALFIGAVTGELCTPWLMSRQRSTRLLVAGQVLTAVPSLIYILPDPAVWAMICAASARGIGMGMSIVVSVALLSELTEPGRRGASIGFYGLALGVPGIVVPSIGVFLLANGRIDADAAIAFASGVLGAVLAFRIPDRPAHLMKASSSLLVAVRRPGMLVLVFGFVLTSSSFGGVITYAPVALPLSGLGSAATFLLVAGAARAVSRWLAGVLGDRQPTRTVLVGGVVSLLAGLIVLAVHSGELTVLLAAVAFGTGYGATQTAAYLAMSERGNVSDAGAVSALWNSGIDLGSSIGGSVIGLSAATYGFGTAVWLIPVMVVMSLPLLMWPGGRTSRPLTEADIPVAAIKL